MDGTFIRSGAAERDKRTRAMWARSLGSSILALVRVSHLDPMHKGSHGN